MDDVEQIITEEIRRLKQAYTNAQDRYAYSGSRSTENTMHKYDVLAMALEDFLFRRHDKEKGGESVVKIEPAHMTNRQLFNEYEEHEKDERHFRILQEMAKRINQRMVDKTTVPTFKQYKLNGAGDEYR